VKTFAIRIGLVLVVALGAFVLRDRLSSAATDLQVGDCFDLPAQVQEIENVQHHPCTEPHTGEVFHVFDHAVAGEAAYPSEDSWATIIIAACHAKYEAYTGQPFDLDGELLYNWLTPTAEGWQQGDHEVTCFLARADEKPMTRSFRVATN
jgi:hypothetical protein